MNDQTLTNPAFEPEIHTISDVDYITGPDAATYLVVHYSTILNLVNSRFQYLKAKKIANTLFITWESAQEEKVRRAGLQSEIDAAEKEVAAKTKVAA